MEKGCESVDRGSEYMVLCRLGFRGVDFFGLLVVQRVGESEFVGKNWKIEIEVEDRMLKVRVLKCSGKIVQDLEFYFI